MYKDVGTWATRKTSLNSYFLVLKASAVFLRTHAQTLDNAVWYLSWRFVSRKKKNLVYADEKLSWTFNSWNKKTSVVLAYIWKIFFCSNSLACTITDYWHQPNLDLKDKYVTSIRFLLQLQISLLWRPTFQFLSAAWNGHFS